MRRRNWYRETPLKGVHGSRCLSLVGQTPWSAAGPLAGFSRPFTTADEGVGRGPGGPPHPNMQSKRH
jgi:hypothetical protein